MIHGRSDAPIIVAIVGVIALLISYEFQLKLLTSIATFGYICALMLGVLFDTNSIDPSGGSTNNLWQIWTISYSIFIGIGLVANIVMSRRKNKSK